MSEDKTYILKPKVKFTNGVNVKGYNKQFEIDGKQGTITLEAFNELFVEFSVAGLTRQVEESLTFLCQYAYDAGYTTGNDRTVTGKDVDLSVKATALKIVGLLLNQEGETK